MQSLGSITHQRVFNAGLVDIARNKAALASKLCGASDQRDPTEQDTARPNIVVCLAFKFL